MTDDARKTEPGPVRTTAEQSIREVEQSYDASWAQGDVAALLECLADDAVVVTPRGDVARGHGEIRGLLCKFLASEARGTEHQSTLLRIEFVTDDVAVVDGQAHITRLSESGGGEPPDFRHDFTDVLVRRNGMWRIAQIRAYQARS
ncbi:MAG: YybH family protein [Mycobacteriaceae bacterium]